MIQVFDLSMTYSFLVSRTQPHPTYLISRTENATSMHTLMRTLSPKKGVFRGSKPEIGVGRKNKKS